MTLDEMMESDTVIRVHENGEITIQLEMHAPEILVDTDENGSILPIHEREMIESVRNQGWELLSGWTDQYGYSGPFMHSSEFVGGALERHIRETPGFYVVVYVYAMTDEEEPAGWVIAYREG